MKYYIEFTGKMSDGAPRIGFSNMESLSISGVIQSFLNKKAKEGIKIVRIKVQEDAINS